MSEVKDRLVAPMEELQALLKRSGKNIGRNPLQVSAESGGTTSVLFSGDSKYDVRGLDPVEAIAHLRQLAGEPIQPAAEVDPLAVNLDELIARAEKVLGFDVSVERDGEGWHVEYAGSDPYEQCCLSWPELIAHLRKLSTPQPVEPAKPEPVDFPALIAQAKEAIGADVSVACGRDGEWGVFVWDGDCRLDRDDLTYAEACEYLRELGTPKPVEPVEAPQPPKPDTVTITIPREHAEFFASRNYVKPRTQRLSETCKAALKAQP